MTPSLKNFYEYLTEYVAEAPDRKMLGAPGRWLTAGEVLARVTAAAAFFRRQGIRPGGLVALRAERSLEGVLVLLGLRLAGAVVALTDPRSAVEPFLERSAVPIPAEAVAEPAGDGRFLFSFGGDAVRFDPLSLPPEDFPVPRYDGREAGFLIFTSGSTGRYKAVQLSEYNLVNNLVDSQPLGLYAQDDIALGALPLDHVFGLVLLAGTIVLRYALYFPDKTDVPSLLDAIEGERITRMNGVPSLYLALAEQGKGRDLSSLRAGFIGGGPVTAEQFCRIEAALGMTLISVYGMSECIGVSCASFRDPQAVRAGGVGPFYSMNTGRILRSDGSEAEVGEAGEICVDGPARMVGYYGDQAPREELFHTGDLGYVDAAGVLHLTGRLKDIIIRSGINLSAARIEAALLSLEGVKAAAVVGLPHPQYGEVPYAMVVLGENAPGDLTAALAPLLAKNELPAGVLTADALPMTRSGKPDKQTIREVLAQWANG